MNSLPAFEYTLLTVIDFGRLLAEFDSSDQALISHQTLLELRKDFTTRFKRFLQNKSTPKSFLGTFINPQDEADILSVKTTESRLNKGKRIFTKRFLSSQTPIISFEESNDAPLVIDKDDATLPHILKGKTFSLEGSPNQYTYKDFKLRIFRNATIGLEIRFAYDNTLQPSHCAPTSINTVITEIKKLEEDIAIRAIVPKFNKFFNAVKKEFPDFLWRDSDFDSNDFIRLSSLHRILTIKGVIDKNNHIKTIVDIENDSAALKEISGLLNRSVWYANYWEKYTNHLKEKFIAYQIDEIFITDDNSSLFYFPGYWLNQKDKINFIEFLITSFHYLLSWETTNHYLEDFIDNINKRISLTQDQPIKAIKKFIHDAKKQLLQIQDYRLILINAKSIGSIVSHGFTSKVLKQFLHERDSHSRDTNLVDKLDLFASNLKLAFDLASDVRNNILNSKYFKLGFGISVVSIILSTFFSGYTFYSEYTKKEPPPSQNAKSMPSESGRIAIPDSLVRNSSFTIPNSKK